MMSLILLILGGLALLLIIVVIVAVVIMAQSSRDTVSDARQDWITRRSDEDREGW